MRNFVLLYINGKRHEVSGEQAFMTVAEYLRYQKGLTGTKIVCSEGDCGACTVLISRYDGKKLGRYHSINSCIKYMYLLDRCHLITVEGLGDSENLHPVQESMVDSHGAQCGYCTPGIVCALAGMTEDLKNESRRLSSQRVKNYLTGNLCRCTGYDPIIDAGVTIDLDKVQTFDKVYPDLTFEKSSEDVVIQTQDKEVFLPNSMHKALEVKHSGVRLTSGATDLGVVQNKGKLVLDQIVSLNNIASTYQIKETKEYLEVGPKASLSDVEEASKYCFPAFSRLLRIFASPQIKNAGTLIGNMANASPISDTIPFLLVNHAIVEVSSIDGSREVDVNDFFKGGYKELDMGHDELISKVILRKSDHNYKLYKVSTRKDLDISTVTMACRYKLEGDCMKSFSLAFGGVGPTVLRMPEIEKQAVGMTFNQDHFKELASQIKKYITPLSDLRGTDTLRYLLCHNLLLKFCDEVMSEEGLGFSEASL